MTIATFFQRRRRLLLLCAATAALHYLAISWLGGALVARPEPAATVTASLQLALPPRVASATPVPQLQPLAPAAPAPRRRRAPPAPAPQAAEPASEAGSMSAVEPASGAASAPAADTVATAAPAASAPAETPAETVPPSVEAAPPAQPGLRRYKVNPPPSADLALEVLRVDADGTRWTGVAAMSWHTDGSRYKLSLEAGISMLITRINLLVMSSEGEIDDYGIAPRQASEQRRGRARTATHFQREQGRISFSASPDSFPLLAGAQDKASLPFQLAAIGRADPAQFGSDIDILVGEERAATVFRFQLVGEEELDTALGRLRTWHLTRPPKPGSYSARLDIWLAPALHWYPVQIRNTEASGALTTQTITKLTLSETGL